MDPLLHTSTPPSIPSPDPSTLTPDPSTTSPDPSTQTPSTTGTVSYHSITIDKEITTPLKTHLHLTSSTNQPTTRHVTPSSTTSLHSMSNPH